MRHDVLRLGLIDFSVCFVNPTLWAVLGMIQSFQSHLEYNFNRSFTQTSNLVTNGAPCLRPFFFGYKYITIHRPRFTLTANSFPSHSRLQAHAHRPPTLPPSPHATHFALCPTCRCSSNRIQGFKCGLRMRASRSSCLAPWMVPRQVYSNKQGNRQ